MVESWKLSQTNLIVFPLIDSNGAEVSGLGTAWTLQISKAGGAFAASAGTKAEISNGVYSYLSTSAEANTVGPVFIIITHASIAQQNLEYCVEQRTINAIEYTYTVTNSVTAAAVEGVQIWFLIGSNVIWYGVTDASGVARDEDGNLPRLDPGTYTVVRQRAGFTAENDTEVVS